MRKIALLFIFEVQLVQKYEEKKKTVLKPISFKKFHRK